MLTLPVFTVPEGFRRRRYGLHLLKPSVERHLAQGVRLYNEAPLLFLDLKDYHRDTYRQAFHEALTKNDYQTVRRLLHRLSETTESVNFFSWYQRQSELLQKPNVWHDFEKRCATESDRQQLLAMKQRWALHGEFSHYSSAALLYIAQDILPRLEQTLHQAEKEWAKKKTKLREPFTTAYDRYLSDFRSTLVRQRKQLGYAMLARLEVAGQQQDMTFDDVTVDLERSLLDLNILDRQKLGKRQPRFGLSPDTFVGFHRYLQADADPWLQQRVQALPWFAKVEDLRGEISREDLMGSRRVSSIDALIPARFRPFVPQRARHPAWLFKGSHFRQRFFESQLPLLAQLTCEGGKADREIGIEDVGFEKHPTWLQLHALDEQLQRAQAEAEVAQNEMHSFFHRQTYHVLQQWQGYLNEKRLHLVSQQLRLMGKVLERLESEPHPLKIQHQQSAMVNFFQNLQTRLSQCEAVPANIYLTVWRAQSQWQRLIQRAQQPQTLEETLMPADPLEIWVKPHLQQLEKNKVLPPDQLEMLMLYVQNECAQQSAQAATLKLRLEPVVYHAMRHGEQQKRMTSTSTVQAEVLRQRQHQDEQLIALWQTCWPESPLKRSRSLSDLTVKKYCLTGEKHASRSPLFLTGATVLSATSKTPLSYPLPSHNAQSREDISRVEIGALPVLAPS